MHSLMGLTKKERRLAQICFQLKGGFNFKNKIN